MAPMPKAAEGRAVTLGPAQSPRASVTGAGKGHCGPTRISCRAVPSSSPAGPGRRRRERGRSTPGGRGPCVRTRGRHNKGSLGPKWQGPCAGPPAAAGRLGVPSGLRFRSLGQGRRGPPFRRPFRRLGPDPKAAAPRPPPLRTAAAAARDRPPEAPSRRLTRRTAGRNLKPRPGLTPPGSSGSSSAMGGHGALVAASSSPFGMRLRTRTDSAPG